LAGKAAKYKWRTAEIPSAQSAGSSKRKDDTLDIGDDDTTMDSNSEPVQVTPKPSSSKRKRA